MKSAIERASEAFAVIIALPALASIVGLFVHGSLTVALWTAGLFALITVVTILSVRVRSRYRRRSLKVRIENLPASPDCGAEEGQSRVLADEDRRLAEYSRMRGEAETELALHLSANPRHAKRILNHERLYALIAEDRRVFGGDPELTHRHLAKWVLIVEHWPRLGAALTRDPSAMKAIEEATPAGTLQEHLNALAPGIKATDELRQILQNGVRLSPVLARLVRFEAAAPAPAHGTV